jgi:hypothetical protein
MVVHQDVSSTHRLSSTEPATPCPSPTRRDRRAVLHHRRRQLLVQRRVGRRRRVRRRRREACVDHSGPGRPRPRRPAAAVPGLVARHHLRARRPRRRGAPPSHRAWPTGPPATPGPGRTYRPHGQLKRPRHGSLRRCAALGAPEFALAPDAAPPRLQVPPHLDETDDGQVMSPDLLVPTSDPRGLGPWLSKRLTRSPSLQPDRQAVQCRLRLVPGERPAEQPDQPDVT